MLSSQPSIINSATLPRHAAQDEAARLKAEILQHGNEIAKLERLAGSVHATRLESWPRSDNSHVLSQTQPSAATGKIIEQLQRDIDHLRLDLQASSTSYESERRAREALRIKCDELELSIAALRAESQAHTQTLSRCDRALGHARETTRDLESSLADMSSEKRTLETSLREKDEIIGTLRVEVESERQKRQQAQRQYQALSDSYLQSQSTSKDQLEIMKSDLAQYFAQSAEEQIQVRAAKEDIILINEQQTRQYSILKAAQAQLKSLRDEQLVCMQSSTAIIQSQIGKLHTNLEDKSSAIEDLKEQLRALQNSLRVI